jgi:hypothetical protein
MGGGKATSDIALSFRRFVATSKQKKRSTEAER